MVNRQFAPPLLGPDIGEFCVDNANQPLRYGVLEPIRCVQVFEHATVSQNYAHTWRRPARIGERVQVLTHSDGAAILLAAARQNGGGGRLNPYKKIRKDMGLAWSIDLPLFFSVPYRARGIR
jgi:hypothetical protein